MQDSPTMLDLLRHYRSVFVDEIKENNFFGKSLGIVETIHSKDNMNMSSDWDVKIEEDLSVTFSINLNFKLPEPLDLDGGEASQFSSRVIQQAMNVGDGLNLAMVGLSEASKAIRRDWKKAMEEVFDG